VDVSGPKHFTALTRHGPGGCGVVGGGPVLNQGGGGRGQLTTRGVK